MGRKRRRKAAEPQPEPAVEHQTSFAAHVQSPKPAARSGVLVTWRIKGFVFKGGLAFPRAVGDQDLMPESEYRTYAVCGMVKRALGGVPSVSVPRSEEPEESAELDAETAEEAAPCQS